MAAGNFLNQNYFFLKSSDSISYNAYDLHNENLSSRNEHLTEVRCSWLNQLNQIGL